MNTPQRLLRWYRQYLLLYFVFFFQTASQDWYSEAKLKKKNDSINLHHTFSDTIKFILTLRYEALSISKPAQTNRESLILSDQVWSRDPNRMLNSVNQTGFKNKCSCSIPLSLRLYLLLSYRAPACPLKSADLVRVPLIWPDMTFIVHRTCLLADGQC